MSTGCMHQIFYYHQKSVRSMTIGHIIANAITFATHTNEFLIFFMNIVNLQWNNRRMNDNQAYTIAYTFAKFNKRVVFGGYILTGQRDKKNTIKTTNMPCIPFGVLKWFIEHHPFQFDICFVGACPFVLFEWQFCFRFIRCHRDYGHDE